MILTSFPLITLARPEFSIACIWDCIHRLFLSSCGRWLRLGVLRRWCRVGLRGCRASACRGRCCCRGVPVWRGSSSAWLRGYIGEELVVTVFGWVIALFAHLWYPKIICLLAVNTFNPIQIQIVCCYVHHRLSYSLFDQLEMIGFDACGWRLWLWSNKSN